MTPYIKAWIYWYIYPTRTHADNIWRNFGLNTTSNVISEELNLKSK